MTDKHDEQTPAIELSTDPFIQRAHGMSLIAGTGVVKTDDFFAKNLISTGRSSLLFGISEG